MDPFVGEIRAFPFNFAPVGWAFCAGQLLPLSQNTALFSLLGTMYGGDGKSNFALPNLQGRAAISSGQGLGLTDRVQGETGGQDTVALVVAEMPSHQHGVTPGGTLGASSAAGNQRSPSGMIPASESTGVTATYSNLPPNNQMMAAGVTFTGSAIATAAGSGVGHENRQPYLVLNYCIALQGVYPSRA